MLGILALDSGDGRRAPHVPKSGAAMARERMAEKDTDRLLPDRDHYRDLAGEILRVVQLARSPFARKELIRPAASFEYRARHLGGYES